MSKHRPGYFRDYFRALGEKRREYLRKRHAENPSRQAEASARYRAKPGIREKRNAAARARANTPEGRAKQKAYSQKYAMAAAHRRLERILEARGASIAWYEETGTKQNWCCAICGRNKNDKSRSKRLFVDHCHATGKLRGLLCTSCNRGIGYLGDDPAIVFSAMNYLLQHNPPAHELEALNQVAP